MKLILNFSFLFCLTFNGVGQKRYNLTFQYLDPQISVSRQENYKGDSLQILKFISSKRLSLISKGNLLASIDSISWIQSEVCAYVYAGPVFKTAKIRINSQDRIFLRVNTRTREKILLSIPLEADLLSNFMKSTLSELTNNGFPFATISLDSISILNNEISAKLKIEKGKKIVWNTIELKGDQKVSISIIQTMLDIKKGEDFSLDKFELANKRLKQIPYLTLIKPCELLLSEGKATLYVYVNASPVSAINGIIGLQQRKTDFKVQFTGDVRIKLLNAFRKGELFDLNWRSIPPQGQQLQIQIAIPLMFKTKFGVDGSFQLVKQDTSFLEIKSKIGFTYLVNPALQFKAFYKNYSSNILKSSSSKPDFASIKSNSYGLSLNYLAVDYLPNPSKGSQIMLESSVGNRFASQKDSATRKSLTFSGSFQIKHYIKIFKRNVLKLSITAESYYAPTIFRNETQRFGGLQSQRGFNEESLFSTTRLSSGIEYRYLLDRNSFFFAFYENTKYEKRSGVYTKNLAQGFGAGISFGTNLGIFSLSYALGKQQESQILLQDGKLHFGYIALF